MSRPLENSVKRIINSVTLVALSLCGAHALADDSMSHVTMTKSQLMKDCMERQKATDVTMSKGEMKKFCKDQLKHQKQTGASAEAPAVDTPHN
jgi:pentapeptide MXKDX repeat protein